MYLFSDDLTFPYVGCVITRPFEPGADAAWAIRGLGYPPSTLPASRVLIIWEHVHLSTSLRVPLSATEPALVFLDATADDQALTYYPFTASAGPRSAVELRWGEPHTVRRAPLPTPIEELLAIWHERQPDDFTTTVAELEQAGYRYIPADDAPRPLPDTVHDSVVAAALASSEPAALEHAYQALRDVLAAMSPHDPRRGRYLVDLCVVLQARYENRRVLRDVAYAVRAARDAAAYPDDDTPARRLDALGTALRIWYEQTGDRDALSESITTGQQAVDAVPDGDLNAGTCQTNLALALHASFMNGGDGAQLDAAIAAARRACAVFGGLLMSDPRREAAAMALGIALHSDYNRTGELAELNEAVELVRSATAHSAASGWLLAPRLTNVGRTLEARYRRTGELDSLREAAQAHRRALAVAPPEHGDRSLYQLNLSATLRALFDRTADPSVLDEAFAVAGDGVRDVRVEHPFRLNHLVNLALIHLARYSYSDDLADLDAAESLLRDGLDDVPATHSQRPLVLSALSEVLKLRSNRTGRLVELDLAADTARDALAALPDDHHNRATVLRTLAEIHLTRYDRLGDPDALATAIASLRSAARHIASPVRVRMNAARRWGETAAGAGLTEVALDGLSRLSPCCPCWPPGACTGTTRSTG